MIDLHSWSLDPKQAVKIQAELRSRLVLTWDGREIATVGGIDVSIKDNLARAAIAVLRYPELAPIEAATAEEDVAFPYVPGLLAFREGPVILSAWHKLGTKPELLMFDGQGIAHPRGIGIAAHMALWLERPSIGVAKSRLYGHHDEPGTWRGDRAELRDERDPAKVIGTVLRTRTDVRPLYVSPGHLIDVSQATEFVLSCCTRYRLPETTRWAHRVAGGERMPPETGFQTRLF
jgi:deoxyribonuclease V